MYLSVEVVMVEEEVEVEEEEEVVVVVVNSPIYRVRAVKCTSIL